MTACAVYRFRDATGALLYIGASAWPVDRIDQHKWQRGASMTSVKSVEIEWFGSREDARRAEVAAIKAESPPWNIASRKSEAA
jgi:predicted GIY-YIG superfamily endonuclease